MNPAYHDHPDVWKPLLAEGLREDDWALDWTTLGALGATPDRKVRARVTAKSEGIWAAEGLTGAVEALSKIRVTAHLRRGDAFQPGKTVCEWEGPAREVLAFERPYLNLAAYVSGIATATRKLVDLVRARRPEQAAPPKHLPRIVPTRKTLPAYRNLAILGVLAGGGSSHRVSLSGGVLVKENHVAAAGSLAKAVAGARAAAPHGLRVECEVRDEDELGQALEAGVDAVLLDNFTPARVQAALKRLAAAPRVVVEVSGGITEANIADYALEGVDVISVGALTHSVRAADFSMQVDGLGPLG